MPRDREKTDPKARFKRMLAAALILAASAAGWIAVRYSGGQGGITGELAEAAATHAPNYIKIYVAGEVEAPGVYDLPEGSRTIDAVEAAGGFTADADEESVNPVKLLRDGDSVRVPTRAAPEPSAIPIAIVDINIAEFEELIRVPGLTEQIARDIIAYREKYGAFKRVEELLDAGLVSTKEFSAIEPYVEAK